MVIFTFNEAIQLITKVENLTWDLIPADSKDRQRYPLNKSL